MSNIVASLVNFRSCSVILLRKVAHNFTWRNVIPLFGAQSNQYIITSNLCTDEKKSSQKGNDTSGGNKEVDNSEKNISKSREDSEEEILRDGFFTQIPALGKKENKGLAAGSRPFFNPEDTAENEIIDYEIQPPTNCCMSGCPNCVWLEYVEKLTKLYTNPELSKEKILKDLNSMEDQNIKAFIMMELRTRKLI